MLADRPINNCKQVAYSMDMVGLYPFITARMAGVAVVRAMQHTNIIFANINFKMAQHQLQNGCTLNSRKRMLVNKVKYFLENDCDQKGYESRAGSGSLVPSPGKNWGYRTRSHRGQT